MRKLYTYIILLIISITCGKVYGQVTIGKDTKPADFSILQLEANNQAGGFLLPRLTSADCIKLRDHLNSDVKYQSNANGLVVFNTETQKLLYWVVSDWAQIDKDYKLIAQNGLTVIDEKDGGIKLGGILSEDNTPINIGANTFSFSSTDSNSKFIVTFDTNAATNPTLIARDKKIGIGTDDPQAQLDIVQTGTVPALRISGSMEQASYVLASDFTGNALWQPFRPVSSIVHGLLSDGTIAGQVRHYGQATDGNGDPYGNDPTYMKDITRTPLRIGRGKWLIMAKYTAYSPDWYLRNEGGSYSAKDFYSYIALSRGSISLIDNALTTMAALPSQLYVNNLNDAPATIGKGGFVTPQLFYFYENNTDNIHELRINAASSKKGTLTSKFGGGYFQALRIDGLLAGGVATEADITCNLTKYTASLKTKDPVSYSFPLTEYATIKANTGGLQLNAGDIIGSTKGVDIIVVGGPYLIATGQTKNVNIKLQGNVENGVPSGPLDINFKIPNTTITNNCTAATLTILTLGSLDCSRFNNIVYSGRGRTISETRDLSLTLSSGSVTLTPVAPNNKMGENNGIIAEFNGISPTTYYSFGSYVDLVPVSFTGSVSNTAPNQFNVPVTLENKSTGESVSTCDGITIYNVEGTIDCSAGIKIPSNAPAAESGKITLTLSSTNSAPYPLKANTVLGSSANLKVTYVGHTRTLTPGVTESLDIVVSSTSALANGTYPVTLDGLYNSGVNIAACTFNAEVQDFGQFDCSTLAPNTTITIPIDGNGDPIQEAVSIYADLGLSASYGTVKLKNGDVLGSTTISGRTYTVRVNEDVTLTAPSSRNVVVKITGPGETTPVTSSNIELKAKGVKACSFNLTFVN